MSEFLATANGLAALITTFFSLIGAAISLFFLVKAKIQAAKDAGTKGIWDLIMSTAKSAIIAAENSGKSGADKKQMVINIVKETCLAQGIDITSFIEQLEAFIDNTVKFSNDLTKK